MTMPLFPSGALIETKPSSALRPYQSRGVINLRAHVLMGKKRILAVAPTGAGKMRMISEIIRLSTTPVLFIGDRRELLDQLADQLARLGITNIGVIRGSDDRYNPGASTQVASIQTLARRDKPKAGLILIDEAHIAASQSFDDHVFRAPEYKDSIIIGWTATPSRLDGRPLGALFEVMEVIARYDELFKRADWLVKPDIFSAPIRADVSSVRIAGSDFDEEQLSEVMHTNELEGQVVDHWLKLSDRHPVVDKNGARVPQEFVVGERRRTIVYAVSVAHSQGLAQRFEKAGVRVAHLDGKTQDTTRQNILRDLGTGAIEVVCNCGILLKGFDEPSVKCIVHARPTQSLVLWRQSCGRVVRPWNGVVPIILDHGGSMDRLSYPCEDLHWTLTSRPVRFGGRLPMKLCRQCFAYVDPNKVVCPFCGAEFPKSEDRPVPAETSVELELRNTEPDALKSAFFHRQITMAKTRGFRPGFAAAMYREYYGDWPPREWSDKANAEFNSDGAWQMSLNRRLERKALKEAREKEEDAAMAAAETREEKFKRLSRAEQHVLIVYASGGVDPRVKTTWYPLKKEACERFVRCGWLSRDGEHYEMTTEGHAACGWIVTRSEEEKALEQTLEVVRGESEFADWLEGEGISAAPTEAATVETRCVCWDDPNPPPGGRCKLCGRVAPGELPHTCHARGCSVAVKPEMLMCGRHWRMVPKKIQSAVWGAYRPGQCDDRKPSTAWHEAADAAIGYVAMMEGQKVRGVESEAMRTFGCEPPPERVDDA